MKSVATIADLAENPSSFIKQAEVDGIVPISRSGRTVVFLVSREKLAAVLETMELQKDSTLMALVRADRAGKLKFKPMPDES